MPERWEDVLQMVSTLRDLARKVGERTWFRGHARDQWPLRSTLHRHVDELCESINITEEADKQDLLYEEYKTRYNDFLSAAWPLLGSNERSDWEVVYSMQDHGIPTRLLDWTTSFACALYFAQYKRQPDEAASIYVLNPERLNQLSCGRTGLIALYGDSVQGTVDTRKWHPRYVRPADELQAIAVVPSWSNPRMIAQSAAFTVAGDSFLPLEDQFGGQLRAKGYIEKIVLSPETYDEAERFLDLAGAGDYGYFPDFEGLARRFKREKKRMLRDVDRFYPDLRKRQG